MSDTSTGPTTDGRTTVASAGSKLAAALVAFQAEARNPKNTAVNPHFNNRYAPLHDLLAEFRPLLAKHGLAVVQRCATAGGQYGVATLLLHTSGEHLDCGFLCFAPQRHDPQGAASAVTYARRYSLCAALGVAGEDDDDGNAASEAPALDDVVALYGKATDRDGVKAADAEAQKLGTEDKRKAKAARDDAIARIQHG